MYREGIADENLGTVIDQTPEYEEIPCKRIKSEDTSAEAPDIHRTGAKCLPLSQIQDPRLPGVHYHVTGAVRTKPGRGDPTLSVSCSDKLARWNAVGIQGALLSIFIDEPIRMEMIVIAGKFKLLQPKYRERTNMNFHMQEAARIRIHHAIEPSIKERATLKPFPSASRFQYSPIGNPIKRSFRPRAR